MKRRAHRVAAFALGFFPPFAIAVWLYPTILPLYQRVVLGAVNAILSSLSPLAEVRAVAAERWEFLIHRGSAVGVATYAAPGGENVGLLTFFHLVVLSAMLLATPLGLIQRLRLWAIGVGLMLGAHVFCVAGCAYGLAVIGDPGRFLFQALPILVGPLATASAIVIWGSLTWRYWLAPSPSDS
jgi:hypothetical protein